MIVVYHGWIQKIPQEELIRFLRSFAKGEGPDFGDYSDGDLGNAKDLETLTPFEAIMLAEQLENSDRE